MSADITITIRPASLDDAPGIARVHVDSWRTTYRGIVPDSVLDSIDYDTRAGAWRRGISDTTSSQRVSVAETPVGEIIGFVASGPERSGDYPGYTGEIYAIYLLEAWQGLGLGRRLMIVGVNALLEQGHESMIIWALTENPACDFYSRMGGRPIATQTVTMGRKTLEETGFGWDNIRMMRYARGSEE